MFRAQQEFGRTIPNGDDDLVAGEERLKRLVSETGKTKITDLDDTGGCDEDIGRLEITVNYMSFV